VHWGYFSLALPPCWVASGDVVTIEAITHPQ